MDRKSLSCRVGGTGSGSWGSKGGEGKMRENDGNDSGIRWRGRMMRKKMRPHRWVWMLTVRRYVYQRFLPSHVTDTYQSHCAYLP